MNFTRKKILTLSIALLCLLSFLHVHTKNFMVATDGVREKLYIYDTETGKKVRTISFKPPFHFKHCEGYWSIDHFKVHKTRIFISILGEYIAVYDMKTGQCPIYAIKKEVSSSRVLKKIIKIDYDLVRCVDMCGQNVIEACSNVN